MKRGISPVAGVMIIVLITIVIGIAVTAWLTGAWRISSEEQLKVHASSELLALSHEGDGGAALTLSLFNEGDEAVEIIEIRVGGKRCIMEGRALVEAGKRSVISCRLDPPSGVRAGNIYTVRIYTDKGTLFVAKLVAKRGGAPGGGEPPSPSCQPLYIEGVLYFLWIEHGDGSLYLRISGTGSDIEITRVLVDGKPCQVIGEAAVRAGEVGEISCYIPPPVSFAGWELYEVIVEVGSCRYSSRVMAIPIAVMR